MSCRETSGNSATTSLIKFLTGAPEKLVSHEFHNLRRDAKEIALVESPESPASPEDVTYFLEGLRTLASNDTRVKESRRASLLNRIDAAKQDVQYGRGPNRATFYAWSRLESAVNASKDSFDDPEENSSETLGTTPEGLEISLGDVQAARRMSDEAKLKADSRSSHATIGDAYMQRLGRTNSVLGFAAAEERAARIEAAFDSTDSGYKILMNDERREESHVDHAVWKQRVARADNNRSLPNPVADAWSAASSESLPNIIVNRNAAFSRMRHYESLLAGGKQSSSAAIKLEAARKEAQTAQRIYLYKVGQETAVKSIAQSSKLMSATEWANMPSKDGIDRFDVWKSAEIIAADIDRASVRVGRISKEEAARRELVRAQSRQAILDSEGGTVIDPVNKRFAQTEARKRMLLQQVSGTKGQP